MRLTNQQIEDFFEVGFTVVPDVFTKQEIEALSSIVDKLHIQAKQFSETRLHNNTQFVIEGNSIQRIVWACGQEPSLLEYSRDERITIPASQLLDSKDMDHLICQVHIKEPGDKVHFPWHQDSQHRRYGTDEWSDLNGKGSYVQTAIIIDEVSLDSGPLLFLPGTVKLGHLSLNEGSNEQNELLISKDKLVPVLASPGSLAIFHPFAVHGSKENISEKTRRILINGFAYPNANGRQYPGCGKGERIKL